MQAPRRWAVHLDQKTAFKPEKQKYMNPGQPWMGKNSYAGGWQQPPAAGIGPRAALLWESIFLKLLTLGL